MTTENLSMQELIDFATALATTLPEVLRIAHREEDVTTDVALDVAHFLKLNEQRLGRDLESYYIMGKSLVGEQSTLTYFLEEVVLPLKKLAPTAYAVACKNLKEWGKRVYTIKDQTVLEEILAS